MSKIFTPELLELIKPGDFDFHVGCMNSGKTDRLIEKVSRINRVLGKPNTAYENMVFVLFKAATDTRNPGYLVSGSHSKKLECYMVPPNEPSAVEDIIRSYEHNNKEVIGMGFDEANFLGDQFKSYIKDKMQALYYVVAAGLNKDYRGEPYGIVPYLMALSTNPIAYPAVCDYKFGCGLPATLTQRYTNGIPSSYYEETNIPEIEGEEAQKAPPIHTYGAMCIKHHDVPDSPKHKW